MRVNLHKSQKYLYLYINEVDALRKMALFEDMDETVVNFNINGKKRPIKQTLKDDLLDLSKFRLPREQLKKNFFNYYFNEKR
jgi:hypothetical protein